MASLPHLVPAPAPARPIVDLTPFAIEPPQLGGQIVIRAVNKALASLGQPVEQYSMGVRRADLSSVGQPRRIDIAAGYIEWRRTDPVSLLLFLISAALRIPHVWAGRALALRPWVQLNRAIAGSSAVVFEMPWCYTPGSPRTPSGAPLVYMSHNAEYQLAADWRGRWGGLGRRLAVEIERQEAQMLDAADLTVCITPEDRAALLGRYPLAPERLLVLPRGLDLDAYAPIAAAARQRLRRSLGLEDEIVIVFSGSRHLPNVAAARFAQGLADQLPDGIRVIIVGTVTRHLATRATARSWVCRDRHAPQQFMSIADIALNPMSTGSGMNVKMLEYLAWGLPVVTTPWGARGIAGTAGEHYVVSDLDGIAEQVSLLATNAERRARLGAAGRRLVVERYSAETTARDLLALLADWRRCRPERAAA